MLDISSNAIRLLSVAVGAVMADRIGICYLFRTGGILLGLADVPLSVGSGATIDVDPVLARTSLRRVITPAKG